jgi:hypothetical protein
VYRNGPIYNPVALVSSNLVDWVPSLTQPYLSSTGLPYLTVFGGNQFINYSTDNGFSYSSPDGFTWVTNSSLPAVPSFFTYGQGAFLFASGNSIYQSEVFTTNSSPAATTLGIATYPGVTINGTAGAVYQIQKSTDLNTWQTITNIMLPSSPYIWFDASSTGTGQKFYRSIQMP